MSAETKVDVLPGEARINLTEYSTGITTTIAYAVMHSRPGIYWIVSDEARAAVAELIEAAREVSADMRYLMGRASAEGHDSGQSLAQQTSAKIDAALARIGGAK